MERGKLRRRPGEEKGGKRKGTGKGQEMGRKGKGRVEKEETWERKES